MKDLKLLLLPLDIGELAQKRLVLGHQGICAALSTDERHRAQRWAVRQARIEARFETAFDIESLARSSSPARHAQSLRYHAGRLVGPVSFSLPVHPRHQFARVWRGGESTCMLCGLGAVDPVLEFSVGLFEPKELGRGCLLLP